jgi:hypothetical protein
MKCVVKIVKEFSNPGRFPVSWLQLECGHTAASKVNFGEPYNPHQAHDDSAHEIGPGAVVECESCEWYADKLEKLRALDPATFSHARFRTRDNRGFGKGDLYVYVVDPKSPTRCRLILSIEDTKEAADLIRERFRTSALSPTEKL